MSIRFVSPVRNASASFLALLALAMPKCPLCAIALFSALGIELHAAAPITIGFTVTAVLLIAIRRVSTVALLIGIIGSAAATAGLLAGGRPVLFHAGVAAVVVAAVINAIAIRRRCHFVTS